MMPIVIIFLMVRALTPQEFLGERPENVVQVLVPALGAAAALTIVTVIAYVIWILATKAIFGSESVRGWIASKGTNGFGSFGRLIERLTDWLL